ncbi:MFS transporter [Paenibacillus albicereus]|uniref:MFS transporter n=1 Tax=Paenibacillus albicereus TaxID=2726185 RepID=A0A6H2H3V6_9BACL|nr:MFS transporter [Paenibacillus albicereus]QJC54028.1 MFS transporter [Paenibacillus albicereus]
MPAPSATTDRNWKRTISLFLGGQTISLFGSSLVQYAIMWHITLSTDSGAMMTIAILCGFVPTFFLSPFAGVWADRYDRKKLIAYSDSLIALTTLVMALLFLAGYDALWLLFVMSAIRALGTGVQTPAVGAFIPQLVPAEQLTRVNGVNGTLQAMTMFAAPVVSAGLLSVAPLQAIFFIDVATAIVGVLTLLLLVREKPRQAAPDAQERGYLADLRQGVRYVREHSFLKPFFFFMALYMILISPAAFLSPLQVTRSFGPDLWRLTAIELAFSVGMMAGGLLIAAWQGFRNKAHTMTLSFLVTGLACAGLGVVPSFWVYLALMALVGLMMPVFNTPATVLLQQKVEESYLGRVFGVMGMISSSMMPLGMLLFGPLADRIPIERLLVATGLLIFGLGIGFGRSRQLLRAGEPSGEPGEEKEAREAGLEEKP